MRTLASTLFALGMAYLAIGTWLYFNQENQVYFPSRVMVANPGDIGLVYEDVRLRAGDGEELHGWFVPAEDAYHTLLFFHGNAGNISHRLDSLRLFHDLGFSVFIVDYRGYGRSTGSPSEKGTYLDGKAAWNYLREQRGLAAERIIIFGRSLGGAVATWLASHQQAAALVIESTFTSIPELGAEIYPWLPVQLLARIYYNSRHRLREVESPVLVIHSPEDDIVPFHHGQQLFDAVSGRKSFLEIRGDHNNGFMQSGTDYRNGWLYFTRLIKIDSATPRPASLPETPAS